MTIEEAKKQLINKRKRRRELQEEINKLRDFLKEQGISDVTHIPDHTERNRQMYIKKIQGQSLKSIAAEYQVSISAVKSAVAIILRKLQRPQHPEHTKYADLLQYGIPPTRKGKVRRQK